MSPLGYRHTSLPEPEQEKYLPKFYWRLAGLFYFYYYYAKIATLYKASSMEAMHVQNKLRRSPILYRKYAAAGCRQQRSALGYDLVNALH